MQLYCIIDRNSWYFCELFIFVNTLKYSSPCSCHCIHAENNILTNDKFNSKTHPFHNCNLCICIHLRFTIFEYSILTMLEQNFLLSTIFSPFAYLILSSFENKWKEMKLQSDFAYCRSFVFCTISMNLSTECAQIIFIFSIYPTVRKIQRKKW